MNEFYIHKDEDGNYRPQHDYGIVSAEGEYGEISLRYAEKSSKKCGCTVEKVKIEQI